jgi:hypothetical protein
MNFADKVLYHQIHPLKLGTDILASLVSLYFFWEHKPFIGLILHLAPQSLRHLQSSTGSILNHKDNLLLVNM